MVEKTLPWWRKAVQYALGGIRSGFGLFSQPAKPMPHKENRVLDQREEQLKKETTLEEKVALTDHLPNPETVAGEPATLPDPVATVKQVAELAAEPVIVPVIAPAIEEQARADAPGPVLTSPATERPIAVNVITEPGVEPLPAATEPEVASIQEPVLAPVSEIVAEQSAALSIEAVVEVASAAEPIPVFEPAPETGVEPVIPHTPVLETAHIESIDLVAVETATDVDPPLVLSSKSVRKQKTIQPSINTEPAAALAIEPASEAATDSSAVTVQLDGPTADSPSSIEPVQTPVPAVDQAAPAVELIALLEAAPALVLTSKPIAEPKPVDQKAIDKAADKVAAKQKARDDQSEESPFSVFVGQVYDGPLDLLLDLIRKQDIDIYDIPIAKITAQFLAYVNRAEGDGCGRGRGVHLHRFVADPHQVEDAPAARALWPGRCR